jgi:hypothetical protein
MQSNSMRVWGWFAGHGDFRNCGRKLVHEAQLNDVLRTIWYIGNISVLSRSSSSVFAMSYMDAA